MFNHSDGDTVIKPSLACTSWVFSKDLGNLWTLFQNHSTNSFCPWYDMVFGNTYSTAMTEAQHRSCFELDGWLLHIKMYHYQPKMVLHNSNYWSSYSHPCRIVAACHQPGYSVIGHDIWDDIMWFLGVSLERIAIYKNWIRIRYAMDYSDSDSEIHFDMWNMS